MEKKKAEPKTRAISPTSVTTQSQVIDLIDETYVDGIASIGIRQNVAKIDFYQASPVVGKENNDEQKESRRISHRLVLPAVGLVEIYNILDEVIQKSKEKKKAL